MNRRSYKPVYICVWLLGTLSPVAAFSADWQMDPALSTLTFDAIQQRAEFQGSFKAFSAQIDFDPASPEAGRIDAVVQLASVETQNAERDEYLVLPEWLDVPQWPEATYSADTIRADGDNWIAEGALTLKGISLPVELHFSFIEDDSGAAFSGTADLKRLDFNVGTGGWTDTRWVGDPVKVNVELRLTKAIQGLE